ncbi:tetratricopeptide repeat protein [Pedobacter sp. WC2423]|uniref:tetratricopeptide repeat protein n=1 Tax=Pedobacter sp. WC2423 TaxID=3234142 RepID=UPI0034679625
MENREQLNRDLEEALNNDDIEEVYVLYSKLIKNYPTEYFSYRNLAEYMLTNYEEFMDTEAGVEETLVSVIKKIKSGQSLCEDQFLANLHLYEYKLIDILTEYDPAYFDQFSGAYQIGLLNKVIELDPSNIDAYEKRGAIFQAIGQKDQAKADFDQMAILLNAKASNPLKDEEILKTVTLAVNQEINGKELEACRNFEKILAQNTNDTVKKVCYQALIRIYGKLHNLEKVDEYQDLLDSL